MAIYHLHVKNISRRHGRSIVAAAAYRAGETLPNEAEERLSAFGGRRDVLHNEIALPEGAPDWMADRARLWNGVEEVEVRKDARLAKEIEVALPRELSRAGWIDLARQLAAAYAAKGFVADFAVHDDGSGHNPHAHILLTTRVVGGAGFGPKIRAADGRKFVEDARALWADLANTALVQAGLDVSIDPRSHARAGVERTPTVHRGPDAEERRQRRENMALSRLLPRRERPYSSDDRDRLADWPKDQLAHRHGDDLPVPGPNGELISQRELDDAQGRMVAEMEAPRDPEPFDMAKSDWWSRPAPTREAVGAEPHRDQEPFDMAQSQWWNRQSAGQAAQGRPEALLDEREPDREQREPRREQTRE